MRENPLTYSNQEHQAVLDTRLPSYGNFTLPTVVEFRGAKLTVLAVDPDWEKNPAAEITLKPLADRVLPSREIVKDSLWAPSESMKAIREWTQYACHDLRIVSRKPEGSLMYLVTRRVEPGWHSNIAPENAELLNEDSTRVQHTAPINGCWWPPGGRILIPKLGSILEQQGFDVIDSLLLKLKMEIGVSPEHVMNVHLLGVGDTHFPCRMENLYRGTDDKGDSYEFSLPVEMQVPQRTLNKNYVIELVPDTLLEMNGLSSECWIDAETYQKYREQFCGYEQKFIDALFRLNL